MKRYLRDVLSVDQYSALLDVIETRDQVDHGTLSGACRSYERHAHAGLDGKRYIVQNFFALVIREAYILKLYFALDRRHFHSVGSVIDLDLFVHGLEDPLEIRHVVYNVVEYISEVHDRLPETRRIARDRDDHADGLAARGEYYHTENVDRGSDEYRDRIDTGPDRVVVADRFHPGLAAVAREARENLCVFVLTRKYLCDARADDIFLQIRVQVRVLVRNHAPCLTLLVLHYQHEHCKHGHTAKYNE